MNALTMVNLTLLMDPTSGRPGIRIGLIDGPVATEHPDLASTQIQKVTGNLGGCSRASSVACLHGTFVAGVLCAKRDSKAPAISPGCTLLVRPIFTETDSANSGGPNVTPQELASAIVEIVDAGAHVINLSAAPAHPSSKDERTLEDALDYAARHGVITVAAAGNQGTLGTTTITRHPWVIPVAACDLEGRPTKESNLATSIGRRGLSAPGDGITSLGTDGKLISLGGTSAATPFVTGTVALLWSEFPRASPTQVKLAITGGTSLRRNTLVPPLLNAWSSYQLLSRS
jgi:subtilisin family serine protease